MHATHSLTPTVMERNLDHTIYQSSRTHIARIFPDGKSKSIIRKETLGATAIPRRRHESTILQRLQDIDGVPKLVHSPDSDSALLLEDTHGVSLADAIRDRLLEPLEQLEFALRLTRIVAAVHRAGVVHKDINPANILVAGPRHRPELIDFDCATTFAEERPAFRHHDEIVGTLEYIAPEQTGRMGRSVDHRADLYSLGATLYELTTGRPPFDGDDPLQLIHDHLARVPVSPAELVPGTRSEGAPARLPSVPPVLSAIIMLLLEKEPDLRYQSAEGLAHDLLLLSEHLSQGEDGPFPLRERDFPRRLAAPSRLVGRVEEAAALQTAFADIVNGHSRSVLVAGAPGVGKTALINELRPLVTAQRGRFVSGKFDQYRRDKDSDAVRQAGRSLACLLLAEPETEVASLRARLRDVLGSNAGLLASVNPELGVLLDVPPEAIAGDPQNTEARLIKASVDTLRAIASPSRPLVMVIDDLQWAAPLPISFIDAMISAGVPGVLLVCAYRETEVNETSLLYSMLRRWMEPKAPAAGSQSAVEVAPPLHLRLRNLPPSDIGLLIEEMLRLPGTGAAKLAGALSVRTGGNPYDTVELVNALRQDGVLELGDEGWAWNDEAVRRHIGRGDVIDLLAVRISRLPSGSRELVEIMACLGGEVEMGLLQAAADLPPLLLEERLAAPLEDGLLAMDQGASAPGSLSGNVLRFRHDRVQQAAYDGMEPEARREVHLTVARRLAATPGMDIAAAEQYLQAVASLNDSEEIRRVVELFRQAAANVRLINHAVAERYLSSAAALLRSVETADDAPLFIALETDWHLALSSLGRFEEADALYESIVRRCEVPLDLARAATVQISNLTNRGRSRDAVDLGLEILRSLGVAVPENDTLGLEIGRGLDALFDWAGEDIGIDLQRPEVTNPRIVAIGNVINRIMPPSFFCDQAIMAWLVMESQRLWAQNGACASLVGPLSHAPFVTSAIRQDFRTGYGTARRVLRVSETRGYEPETSQARFLFSLGSGQWFEPLEENVLQAHRAHEGLLAGGDLQNACFTFYASIPQLLDCAPTLDACLAEIEAGLAFAGRTGNTHATQSFLVYKQFVQAMRGETDGLDTFSDSSFDESEYVAAIRTNTTATANYHIIGAYRALLAANAQDLAHHAAAAMPLLPSVQSTYPTAVAHLFQAMALAERCRNADPGARNGIAQELDVCRDWLARRAVDAPGNFLHLLKLVEAECAWAIGDSWTASTTFDTAMLEAQMWQRPWHRALIAERSAIFHLEHGLEHAGQSLLLEARRYYHTWGAAGKVRQMERAYPFLSAVAETHPSGDGRRSSGVSSDTIDLLAILRASQALSSETRLDHLQARVVEQLRVMTGATAVTVVLWHDDTKEWRRLSNVGEAVSRAGASSLPGEAGSSLSVAEAGAGGLLPLTAFHYAERNREPLLVDNAVRDDRFARDPYFAGVAQCSLLVVPILSQGAPRAVLILENRLSRGAFSAERLDAVTLIAGQLAVSLDNALLYRSLERKVADRTEALEAANQRLETLSITDPLTGLANRRRFAEVYEAEWTRAYRNQSSISAMMIDIDHFKLYNDHYGHLRGDACLQAVASALSESVRLDRDLVARYGGEEFAIILPGADLQAAGVIAERARAAVAALKEPHDGASGGIVTVSIGIAATVPGEPAGSEQLLGSADIALYNAKRSGRNRVVSAVA